MQLIDDAADYFKFWSTRLHLAALIFGALEVLSQLSDILPQLQGLLPAKTFVVLSGICTVAGLVARVLKQNNLGPSQ
jgi:hypothetical protein